MQLILYVFEIALIMYKICISIYLYNQLFAHLLSLEAACLFQQLIAFPTMMNIQFISGPAGQQHVLIILFLPISISLQTTLSLYRGNFSTVLFAD